MIGQSVQRLVESGRASTQQQEEANLVATLRKPRRFPREDLVRGDLSLLARRRAHHGSRRRDAARRRRRYVRRIPFPVISARWFYFGDAMLFYSILS